MKRIYSPAPSQQAFDWIDHWTPLNTTQTLPLIQAAELVLAQDINSGLNIPAQALCIRDGYAVKAADTLGAGDYNPLPLRLAADKDIVAVGSAIQVSAGDNLPTGADAILSPEQADLFNNTLEVACSLAPGEGVVQTGEECRQHAVLANGGQRLRPQHLARLAQAGIHEVCVFCPPRVQLFIAGHFTQDADSVMLSTLLRRDGAELTTCQQTTSVQQLEQGLNSSDADIILIAGGSGYGSHDFSVKALQQQGEVTLDGVAIHPGGSLVLGQINHKPVLILPGNPLSCLCAYDLIAARLIRKLARKQDVMPYPSRKKTLSRKLVSRIGQFELARMQIDGDYCAPLAVADDRILASSVRADGFVLLQENSEGYAEGSEVEVYLYDC